MNPIGNSSNPSQQPQPSSNSQQGSNMVSVDANVLAQLLANAQRSPVPTMTIDANSLAQFVATTQRSNASEIQTITLADGSTYRGETKNGIPHGRGVQTYPASDTQQKYEGEFIEGKRSGKGYLLYKDGQSYEGDFENDLFNGAGIYKGLNGLIYNGMHKNGYRHGQGTMTYLSSLGAPVIYIGAFDSNKMHGQGTRTWSHFRENGVFNNNALWDGQYENNYVNQPGNGPYYRNGKRTDTCNLV